MCARGAAAGSACRVHGSAAAAGCDLLSDLHLFLTGPLFLPSASPLSVKYGVCPATLDRFPFRYFRRYLHDLPTATHTRHAHTYGHARGATRTRALATPRGSRGQILKTLSQSKRNPGNQFTSMRASYTASLAASLAGVPSRSRPSSAGSAPLLSLEAS